MTRSPSARIGAAALVATLAAGCAPTTPDHDPTASPSPSATGPHPPAVIGALHPAEAVTGEAEHFESHPAVLAVRTTNTVLAWAALTDSVEFAQFTQHIDPESRPSVLDDHSERYPYAPIGPSRSEVRSVTDLDDGTVVVQVCQGYRREIAKDDGAPPSPVFRVDGLVDITLSPLTGAEVLELSALGLDPPPMRVRRYDYFVGLPDCDATSAVAQEFVNWREVAPVGSYSGTRTGWGDVVVLGEDEPRRREDMP